MGTYQEAFYIVVIIGTGDSKLGHSGKFAIEIESDAFLLKA